MAYTNVTIRPETFEEFAMDPSWQRKILSRLSRFSLRDTLNSAEDLLQDIYLALYKTNYIERFDPDKGRVFEVYLYVFVDNFLRARFKREHSKNGFSIVNKLSLEESFPEDDTFGKGAIYMENMDLSGFFDDSPQGLIELSSLIEELKKRLSEFNAHSVHTFNQKTYSRDPLTIFTLLFDEGLSVKEVAEVLGTSSQFIYNKIRDMKKLDVVVDILSSLK